MASQGSGLVSVYAYHGKMTFGQKGLHLLLSFVPAMHNSVQNGFSLCVFFCLTRSFLLEEDSKRTIYYEWPNTDFLKCSRRMT